MTMESVKGVFTIDTEKTLIYVSFLYDNHSFISLVKCKECISNSISDELFVFSIIIPQSREIPKFSPFSISGTRKFGLRFV